MDTSPSSLWQMDVAMGLKKWEYTLINFVWPYEPVLIVAYVIIINCVAFGAFALDKYLAKKHMWRISERTLLTMAVFGGTIGAITGQQMLRHKTYKQPFKSMLFMIPILQILIAVIFLVPAMREILLAVLGTLGSE